MKVAFLFLGIWILVAFTSLDLLSDLKSSKVYVLKLDFNTWKSEIDSIPSGFDDIAQQHLYSAYGSSISELESFMKEEKIKFMNVGARTSIPNDSDAYLLDYNLKCAGGPGEKDWWLCDNGFFFQNIKSGLKSEYLGTVKVVKTLKKKLKNKK